jgi:hypothetical protein
VPPEQGHGPGGVWVAKLLRAFVQEFEEQVPLWLAEQGGPPGAVAIRQSSRVTVTAGQFDLSKWGNWGPHFLP